MVKIKNNTSVFSVLAVATLLVSGFFAASSARAATINVVSNSTNATYYNAIVKTADRLVTLQDPTTGSWDWIVTGATTSTGTVYLNVTGVTAEGLLSAYSITGKQAYLDAAKKAGDYIISQVDASSPKKINAYNILFLQKLSIASGIASYSTKAAEYFEILYSDTPTTVCASGCVNSAGIVAGQKAVRSGFGDPSGIVLWDLVPYVEYAGFVSDTTHASELANAIIIEANLGTYVSSVTNYDLGLAAALKAAALVGDTANVTALSSKITSVDASFGLVDDGKIQTTSYMVRAFKLSSDSRTSASATYIVNSSGLISTGGWIDTDSSEYAEVDSEAITALVDMLPQVVQYYTIQDAINAASSGDTINVGAGTYNERIEITQPLNLVGGGVGNSIIDATSFGTTGNVIDITTLVGNTKIEGFDIITGNLSNGIHSSSGTDTMGKIEILNNRIIGNNYLNAGDYQFGIIAGYGDVRKLIISGNEVSDTYNNSILIERQIGESEVTGNILNGAFPSIFFMTYAGNDVSALQKVNDNTIDMSSADPTWYGSAITFNSARRNNPTETLGSGKYTNISITGNIIQNLPNTALYNYKGIYLVNDAPGGTEGETTGAVISNNQISGVAGNNAIGIKLSGKITGTIISGNTITGLSVGLLGANNNNGVGIQYPSTTTFSDKNTISGNTSGINWPSSSPLLDATNNWWGAASPSFGTIISGNVNHIPWYTNAGMTTFTDGTTATATDAVYTSTTDGQADLPAGATDVVLTNDTTMDLSGGVATKSSPEDVVIGGNTVTLTKSVTLQSGIDGDPVVLTNSNPDVAGISASIPDGTNISGPAKWDGTIMPPTSGTPAGGNPPAGFSVGDTVISIGSPAGTLVFDNPVTLLLENVTGTVGYRPAGLDTWIQITNVCADPYATPGNPPAGSECAISNGTDTKIVTYHFTSFGSLTVIPASSITSSSGGGGSIGGSGSAYDGPVYTPSATPTPEVLGEAITRGNPANLTANGLKEGDTVSAGGTSDPDVYVVNQFGYKRLFLSPVIFEMYGHLKNGWGRVRSIIAQTRDAFPTSVLFRNCETNDLKVYALETTGEDTATLHWVNLTGDQAVAQDPEFFKKVFCINSNEFNWYSKSSTDYTALSQVPVYSRK